MMGGVIQDCFLKGTPKKTKTDSSPKNIKINIAFDEKTPGESKMILRLSKNIEGIINANNRLSPDVRRKMPNFTTFEKWHEPKINCKTDRNISTNNQQRITEKPWRERILIRESGN